MRVTPHPPVGSQDVTHEEMANAIRFLAAGPCKERIPVILAYL